MAVYKRSYKTYAGALTPQWQRFLVPYRFSSRDLFKSKFLMAFFVACFFYPLGALVWVYICNNLSFLAQYNLQAGSILKVTPAFFSSFLGVQGFMAMLMTAFLGPGLVSPDLTNNALPLYFCRPFSRTEYVLGKMMVLFVVLSEITWVPGLVLFFVQSSLAGRAWLEKNWYLGMGIFLGSVLWIVLLALISMALSAWVRWKVVAGALVLGVFFGGAGFGRAINAVMRIDEGGLIDPARVMLTIWGQLLRFDPNTSLDVWQAWIALGLTCTAALWLLSRKLRAYEVVQ